MKVIVGNEPRPETMTEKLLEVRGGPLWVDYTGEEDEYGVLFLGWTRLGEGTHTFSASTLFEENQSQAAITMERNIGSYPAPLRVASVSFETGLVASWETKVYDFLPEANENVLLTFPESEGRLESLALEFGISLRLLQSVWEIVARYVRNHSHLALTAERLVDPEVGRPVEIVLEIRGTRSGSETTRVWEEVDAAIDEAVSEEDREVLAEMIGVHVHRGSTDAFQPPAVSGSSEPAG